MMKSVQEAVLGTVTIGEEVRIGPNVVVMTDVPAGATVFVNPACASVHLRETLAQRTLETGRRTIFECVHSNHY